LTGIAVDTPKWIKERPGREGCEDIGPDDTFDGDYGRLLEAAAMRKYWRHLTLTVIIRLHGGLRSHAVTAP